MRKEEKKERICGILAPRGERAASTGLITQLNSNRNKGKKVPSGFARERGGERGKNPFRIFHLHFSGRGKKEGGGEETGEGRKEGEGKSLAANPCHPRFARDRFELNGGRVVSPEKG